MRAKMLRHRTALSRFLGDTDTINPVFIAIISN